MKSKILELQKQYKNKTKTIKEHYEESLKKMNGISDYNASLQTIPFIENKKSNSILNGAVYSLKDNHASKGFITTGGSKFLKNYIPNYNSTVKSILDHCNCILLSKDNLDEFGLGGTGTYSAFNNVINPIDKKRITGGSSSGSSVLVQSGVVDFAIATDTGDSIRKPASFLGIYGYKPTYGLVSRYGVFPYAPSLDHVGILSSSLIDISLVLSEIVKKDNKDFSSIGIKDSNFYENLKSRTNLKLLSLSDVVDNMELTEKEEYKKYLNNLKENFKIDETEFGINILKLIDPVYKAISYSEASTCYANLNGILFGEHIEGKNFNDISLKSRTSLFGSELKRRFIIGSYITLDINFNDVYLKSKQIRTLINNRINELLNKYDAILLPGASRVAPLLEDVANHKRTCSITDDALQIANFAGLPSLTIPAIKINNLPLGINITCKQKDDQLVLDIAKTILESQVK